MKSMWLIQGPVTDFFEYDNKQLGSIRNGKFLIRQTTMSFSRTTSFYRKFQDSSIISLEVTKKT